MTANDVPPQGIEQAHIAPVPWHRFVNPIAVLAIAIFLGLALGGLFGGQPHPTRVIETPSATITLQFPETLRNGEFFEMRANITAKQTFEDVGFGVSNSYWRDLTINTMIPAPVDEKSKQGRYVLSYGPLKAGDTLTLKFDGQVNPPLFAGTEGELYLMDGEVQLASVPLNLRIFP